MNAPLPLPLSAGLPIPAARAGADSPQASAQPLIEAVDHFLTALDRGWIEMDAGDRRSGFITDLRARYIALTGKQPSSAHYPALSARESAARGVRQDAE